MSLDLVTDAIGLIKEYKEILTNSIFKGTSTWQ